MDMLEPFDVAYLNNEPSKVPDISSYEKRLYRKISILEKKLRRAHVSFEFDVNQMEFVVSRIAPSGYPINRRVYIDMAENEYVFGDENFDYIYDGKVSVVVEAVKKWCNSQFRKEE